MPRLIPHTLPMTGDAPDGTECAVTDPEEIDDARQLEKGRPDRARHGPRRAALAQLLGRRAARSQAADPVRGPAAPLGGLRQDQERLRRAGQRREADPRGHQRHGSRARPALGLPGRRRVQGAAGQHAGQVRRPRHRGRRRGGAGPRDLPDRGHARVPRRHQDRRPDREDRRHRRRAACRCRRRSRRCAAGPAPKSC